MSHHAVTYTNFQSFLADHSHRDPLRTEAWCKRKWNAHIAKHGNVPLVVKCSICSGNEYKREVKLGRWKPKKERRADVE